MHARLTLPQHKMVLPPGAFLVLMLSWGTILQVDSFPSENEGNAVNPNCTLPCEVGPCKAAFQRWFYDSKTSSCREFSYGGCHGNANNFESLIDCEHVCGEGSVEVQNAESGETDEKVIKQPDAVKEIFLLKRGQHILPSLLRQSGQQNGIKRAEQTAKTLDRVEVFPADLRPFSTGRIKRESDVDTKDVDDLLNAIGKDDKLLPGKEQQPAAGAKTTSTTTAAAAAAKTTSTTAAAAAAKTTSTTTAAAAAKTTSTRTAAAAAAKTTSTTAAAAAKTTSTTAAAAAVKTTSTTTAAAAAAKTTSTTTAAAAAAAKGTSTTTTAPAPAPAPVEANTTAPAAKEAAGPTGTSTPNSSSSSSSSTSSGAEVEASKPLGETKATTTAHSKSTTPSTTSSPTTATSTSSTTPTSTIETTTVAETTTSVTTTTTSTTEEVSSTSIALVPAPAENGDLDRDAGEPSSQDQDYANQFRNYKLHEHTSSHFAAFFLSSIVLVFAIYIAYHNRQKIIAVIIEGRSDGRRRIGNYRKLESNVEEAMPSMRKYVA